MNSRTSSWPATGACGRCRRSPRTSRLRFRTPQAISPHDERMAEHLPVQQEASEPAIGDSKVIDRRPTYRPGSRGLPPRAATTPGDGSGRSFRAAQRREPPGAFACHQRLEARPDHGSLLPKAAQLGGATEQGIIDIERGSHMHQYACLMHTSSSVAGRAASSSLGRVRPFADVRRHDTDSRSCNASRSMRARRTSTSGVAPIVVRQVVRLGRILMSQSRSSMPLLTTSVSGSAEECVARPAMKQPPSFSTGDPSYLVVASTPDRAMPYSFDSVEGAAGGHCPPGHQCEPALPRRTS